MFKTISSEWLKNKRTIVRKLVWFFPLLVVIMATLLFMSTGYVVQTIVNQWSIIWVNFFLALIIGLIDRHEKNSTEYKMILSSPINLFNYELGRILHGVLLSFIATVVLSALILLESCFMTITVPVVFCIIALFGIFITSLWEIPFYIWLSRVTNLYFSIGVAFIGSILGIFIAPTAFGKVFPFTWIDLMPVSLIKMNVNGLIVKDPTVLSNNYWTLGTSIILFIVLSFLSARSFKKQVIEHA
ncbi:lantibiotic immunity ABC transporter MutE/EpiE family permease subunit [Lactobacillus sp. PV034]|uniref:lantibiotic immunity ABC transporter MutE/EpiE family permease subunit n=1 Tax=Lactobacillus sp. PV034 TaxID=2594495 RepID=UPI00223FF9B9|nr:lantibiotic immunity ABC transporter MutE/EpiE family permease subunit [Lactobacillus sp. PV034]QNQ81385.1 lantibiotic immunity ABC transporter MutE/EpiE family permease subunit [Lactobacillus sp. PV034]